jgi:hypothetical protein
MKLSEWIETFMGKFVHQSEYVAAKSKSLKFGGFTNKVSSWE